MKNLINNFTILVSNLVASAGTFAGLMWLQGAIGGNKIDTVVRVFVSALVTFYTMKELVENQLRK